MKNLILFFKSENPCFKWAKSIFGLAIFAGPIVLLTAFYNRNFLAGMPAQVSLSYYNLRLGILEEISIFYLFVLIFTFGVMVGVKITEKK